METEELYAALDALLRELASQGKERLPSERELAMRFSVTRAAVRRALAELEAHHRIVRVVGRSGGAFISEIVESSPIPALLFDTRPRRIVRDLNTVKGVPQMLRDQGYEPETRSIAESMEAAPAIVAHALGLKTGAKVVSLLRLRLADGAPLSLERMYLDAARFPGLLDHSPIPSLYELLSSRFGVTVFATDETVEITSASRQVAALLGVRPWEPLLAVRRVSRAADGTPIETSVDLFRADRTRLTVSTLRK